MNLDLNSLKYVDDIRVERASILTANTTAIPFSNAVRIYTYPIESNIDTLEAEE